MWYRPNQSAVVDFYFTEANGFSLGDFDTIKDMVNMGIAFEIITRAGAYYSYAGERWQGKEATLAALRSDLGMQDALRTQVLAHG
jgi:recombination protein RecA